MCTLSQKNAGNDYFVHTEAKSNWSEYWSGKAHNGKAATVDNSTPMPHDANSATADNSNLTQELEQLKERNERLLKYVDDLENQNRKTEHSLDLEKQSSRDSKKHVEKMVNMFSDELNNAYNDIKLLREKESKQLKHVVDLENQVAKNTEELARAEKLREAYAQHMKRLEAFEKKYGRNAIYDEVREEQKRREDEVREFEQKRREAIGMYG